MTEYNVVLAVGNGLELPVPVHADTQEAAENIALETYRDHHPNAKVVGVTQAVSMDHPALAPQEPYIGAIVRLLGNDGKQKIAAIITAVHSDGVSLTVFVPDHLPGYVNGHIPFSAKPKKGHWNWPPRGNNS